MCDEVQTPFPDVPCGGASPVSVPGQCRMPRRRRRTLSTGRSKIGRLRGNEADARASLSFPAGARSGRSARARGGIRKSGNPLGSSCCVVSSITRAPANPIIALGLATITSPRRGVTGHHAGHRRIGQALTQTAGRPPPSFAKRPDSFWPSASG
jgi:hypothetical protein